jgi:hypothetical protein
MVAPRIVNGALAAYLVVATACQTEAPPVAPAAPTTAAPACELGIWDDVAHACGIPPHGATGDPGGWAGCMQATAPQSGRCFTGTHWASCECACNGTTKWNDAKRRCE